jgi:hypothetical protein
VCIGLALGAVIGLANRARATDTTAETAAVAAAAPTTTVPSAVASPGATPSPHNRLEELFIWKTSEDLKLPPGDEQKFTDIIHQINLQRRVANQRLEEALKVLANVKSKAETEKALIQYRVLVKDVQNIQVAEIDRLQKLLGPERMSRYLVLKSETTEKLKNLLSSSAPAPVMTIESKTPQAVQSK